MTVAALILMRVVTEGARVACMREMMNSLDDSVHALLCDEIERLGMPGFTIYHNRIDHESGGGIVYKGLARNPESVKSMHGFNIFWVEEASNLSKTSIDLLIPTLRAEGSELWFTFNPNSSADPICLELLKPFEKKMHDGYFEDDLYMVIKCNYTDNPFFPDNLEQLRLAHKEHKTRAEYDHIWLGEYNDEVEGSIIKAEWFDACKDAHKDPRYKNLFKPRGAVIAAFDPSDTGTDAAGFAIRHGSIIETVKQRHDGEVDEKTDWATDLSLLQRTDWFVWDGDGLGTGLKRQVADAFEGTRVEWHMFKGSLSGSGQDNADDIYLKDLTGGGDTPVSYSDTFKNNRSQYYIKLANKMYNTYKLIVKGEHSDVDDLISLNTDGIDNIEALRSELCRIPLKPGAVLTQIMGKQEMKTKLKISSPNMADSIMMSMWHPRVLERTSATRFIHQSQQANNNYDPFG